MDYLLLAAGFGLLVLGAEGLVRGGVGLAKSFGISPLVIGLTVVAWGTSTPELVVSVQAAMQGSPAIALGNVVGSNVFNVLAILGVAALVSPIVCRPQAILRDGLVGLAAVATLLVIAQTGPQIERWHGGLFLSALVVFTVLVFFQERRGQAAADLHVREVSVHEPPVPAVWLNALFVIAGLATLVAGSTLLIESAVAIARTWGVSETVIGLTLVAAGTSLPELATSALAAFRRQSDIALGNVLGSNIYNILAILGVASLVTPIPIAPAIARVDIWLLMGVALLALAPVATGGRIGRPLALVFLGTYAAYLVFLFNFQS